MDIKSVPTMAVEVTTNDRVYKFVMPMGAPFGEAYDACHGVLAEIVKWAKQAEEQAKRQTEETNS